MLLQRPNKSAAPSGYVESPASTPAEHCESNGFSCKPNCPIHVCCNYQHPHFWAEHICKRHQLLIMLAEDTDAELTWRNRVDTTRTQRLSGQHFIFIEAGIPRSMQWDKEAALICLFLSDDFLENLGIKHLWQGVQIRRCYELAKGDLLIWHLAYILENLCTPGVHNAEQLYVNAVGRILATHLLRVKKLEQCRTDSLAGLTPAQIKQVRSYIHGHLREPIRVQTLARTAGVSKDHFIILFKNTIGMTPHRYVLLKRLQLAQQLIERGKLRTSEIAVEAGFCDQSHMSRCFRKLCSEIASESTRQNGLL